MKKIDARGLICPQPVILTKKALEEIAEGEIEVTVDNNTAKENIFRLAGNMNYAHEASEEGGLYHIKIEKRKGPAGMKEEEESIVISVTSDKLGEGAEELGRILMKSYTYALSEVTPLPKAVLFLNSGVMLTSEGSEALENIKKLENLGVEIVSCGTCLDFYGLKEKLQVGIVGNMYSIIEKMNTANKVISIG